MILFFVQCDEMLDEFQKSSYLSLFFSYELI